MVSATDLISIVPIKLNIYSIYRSIESIESSVTYKLFGSCAGPLGAVKLALRPSWCGQKKHLGT